MPAEHTIRTAVIADSGAIAAVHIQSWRETYPGIMPQQRLDSMNLERSTKHWQANISGAFTVLVAEVKGRIVGNTKIDESTESAKYHSEGVKRSVTPRKIRMDCWLCKRSGALR